MKTNIKPIAIIPARKNSERIKNKNIVNFFGKPLISITLKNLINSKIFSKIYVSTDSKKIAEISKKYGAEVLYPRPKKLSSNKTIILDVMSYEVSKLKKNNIKINDVFCILPTAIFLNKSHFIQAQKKLSKNANFVISIVKENKSALRNFYFEKNNLKILMPKFLNYRTQDLPITYRDAGQLYLANKSKWINKKNIFSNKTKVVLLDSKKFIDIDNYADLKKVKKIFKNEKK